MPPLFGKKDLFSTFGLKVTLPPINSLLLGSLLKLDCRYLYPWA